MVNIMYIATKEKELAEKWFGNDDFARQLEAMGYILGDYVDDIVDWWNLPNEVKREMTPPFSVDELTTVERDDNTMHISCNETEWKKVLNEYIAALTRYNEMCKEQGTVYPMLINEPKESIITSYWDLIAMSYADFVILLEEDDDELCISYVCQDYKEFLNELRDGDLYVSTKYCGTYH